MGRFWHKISIFAKKRPLTSFLIVCVLFLGPSTVWETLHPPTPAEIKARNEELQKNEQQDEAKQQYEKTSLLVEKYTCRQILACKKYADVRQQCAVAGNFDACVNIKMGDEAVQLIGVCTNDGKLAFPINNPPSLLRCWALKVAN